ncbi:hypothetical protein [Aeromonas jandaei]|uniref:hypothetical protein n=1 Tax=Aeromonas jandaei TaxID=650 RepID=UPI00366F6BBF
MQQSSQLLCVNELKHIDNFAADDIEKIKQKIALCRASERPDLAAPYAKTLCEHYSRYEPRENMLWFNAIATDDIFMMKSLMISGFDINTTFSFNDVYNSDIFGSGLTKAINAGAVKAIILLVEQEEIDLDIIGHSETVTPHTEFAPTYVGSEDIIPFEYIYHSPYRTLLETKIFNPDIQDSNYNTALKKAIRNGDKEFVHWLLKNGSSPNQSDGTYNKGTIFGQLVQNYLDEPSIDKLDIIKLMFHYGASPKSSIDEVSDVSYAAWNYRDNDLIHLFDLYYYHLDREAREDDIDEMIAENKSLQSELAEQDKEIQLLKKELACFKCLGEDAKHSLVRKQERTETSQVYSQTPVMKINILNELRATGAFNPGSWISELSIIQQDDGIGIYLEQNNHPISSITVILPSTLSNIVNPYSSAIMMGFDFILRPHSWWQEVDHYIERFQTSLTKPTFFYRSAERLEERF